MAPPNRHNGLPSRERQSEGDVHLPRDSGRYSSLGEPENPFTKFFAGEDLEEIDGREKKD
jgi:hypothetical protein